MSGFGQVRQIDEKVTRLAARKPSYAEVMGRMLLWMATALLGGVAVVMTSLVGLQVMVVAVPLLLVRDRWLAVSGFLTGFGLLWLALTARQLTLSDHDGIVAVWMSVGLVPLVVGAMVSTAVAARHVRSQHAEKR